MEVVDHTMKVVDHTMKVLDHKDSHTQSSSYDGLCASRTCSWGFHTAFHT